MHKISKNTNTNLNPTIQISNLPRSVVSKNSKILTRWMDPWALNHYSNPKITNYKLFFLPSVNIKKLYFFGSFRSTVSSWQCILHAILSCACLDDAYPLIWRLFCNVNFYYSLETTTSRRERSMKRFNFRAPFQTGSSHPNPWTVYLVSCNALKICKRAICRSSSQTVFYFWFFKTNFQIVNVEFRL